MLIIGSYVIYFTNSFVADAFRAPMPYIIGIHISLMEKARSMDLSGVIVLDVDDCMLEDEYDDRKGLPSDAVSNFCLYLPVLYVYLLVIALHTCTY